MVECEQMPKKKKKQSERDKGKKFHNKNYIHYMLFIFTLNSNNYLFCPFFSSFLLLHILLFTVNKKSFSGFHLGIVILVRI